MSAASEWRRGVITRNQTQYLSEPCAKGGTKKKGREQSGEVGRDGGDAVPDAGTAMRRPVFRERRRGGAEFVAAQGRSRRE
jgi:hypothetical protein